LLCDTHAHLDLQEFDNDRDDVIKRASESGVAFIINPGCDYESSIKVVGLSEKYDCLVAAVGIHPNNVSASYEGEWEKIAELSKNPKVAAIGETGLDKYRERTPLNDQVAFFRKHLVISRERSLPVIIHFREVDYDGMELTGLEYFENVKGVFHCFGGSLRFAEKLVDMGFYIGFDGPLTYKKSDRIEIAEVIPLEKCLLETDSPFLTPQKYRGKRNEPAFVFEVARKLADIKKLSVEEVIAVTGAGAAELFNIGNKN